MASDSEASCINDPNFAVICSFLQKFGTSCGITSPDFLELQEMLENNQEVSPELIDLHIKLLRKIRRSASGDRWERVLIKLCHTYCSQDAWELERFGYKKARLSSKLQILKTLLEMQFDSNPKFKAEVNRLTADELRTEPIGRDKHGHSYWYQIDDHCQLRVYREDPDEETWVLVAKDREGLVQLITQLASDDPNLANLVLNEDSNSLEIEKPIIDTGQTSSSTSNYEAEADESSGANGSSGVNESPGVNEDIKDEKQEVTITNLDKNEVEEEKYEESEDNEDNLEEESIGLDLTSQTEGVDLSNKRRKSINEVATNLRIKTTEMYEPVQEQEIDLSLKKRPMDPKQFSSLSVPAEPISLESALRMTTNLEDSDEYDEDSYESDEIELPSHMRHPRLSRPTLLGNAKKKTYSDEDEYSEEIEEPLMLIQGEGSGKDCENKNLEFSEVIEEPLMFFYGEGFGRDSETGNTGKEESTSTDKTALNKENFENSVSASVSSKVTENVEQCSNSVDCNVSSKVLSETTPDIELSPKTNKIGKIVLDYKSSEKPPAIETVSPKKNSRWDVGKPMECSKISDESTNNSINKHNKDTDSSSNIFNALPGHKIDENVNQTENTIKPMFFFGPGCFQFKTPVTPTISKKSDTEPSSENVKNITNSIPTDVNSIEVKEKEETVSLDNKNVSDEPPINTENQLTNNQHKEDETDEIIKDNNIPVLEDQQNGSNIDENATENKSEDATYIDNSSNEAIEHVVEVQNEKLNPDKSEEINNETNEKDSDKSEGINNETIEKDPDKSEGINNEMIEKDSDKSEEINNETIEKVEKEKNPDSVDDKSENVDKETNLVSSDKMIPTIEDETTTTTITEDKISVEDINHSTKLTENNESDDISPVTSQEEHPSVIEEESKETFLESTNHTIEIEKIEEDKESKNIQADEESKDIIEEDEEFKNTIKDEDSKDIIEEDEESKDIIEEDEKSKDIIEEDEESKDIIEEDEESKDIIEEDKESKDIIKETEEFKDIIEDNLSEDKLETITTKEADVAEENESKEISKVDIVEEIVKDDKSVHENTNLDSSRHTEELIESKNNELDSCKNYTEETKQTEEKQDAVLNDIENNSEIVEKEKENVVEDKISLITNEDENQIYLDEKESEEMEIDNSSVKSIEEIEENDLKMDSKKVSDNEISNSCKKIENLDTTTKENDIKMEEVNLEKIQSPKIEECNEKSAELLDESKLHLKEPIENTNLEVKQLNHEITNSIEKTSEKSLTNDIEVLKPPICVDIEEKQEIKEVITKSTENDLQNNVIVNKINIVDNLEKETEEPQKNIEIFNHVLETKSKDSTITNETEVCIKVKEINVINNEIIDISNTKNVEFCEVISSDDEMGDSCSFQQDYDDCESEIDKPDEKEKSNKNVQSLVDNECSKNEIVVNNTEITNEKDVLVNEKVEEIKKEEKHKPPVLICVDVAKLQAKPIIQLDSVNESKQQSNVSSPRSVESVGIDNDESSDVIICPETDPLACTEEEILLSKKEEVVEKPQSLSLATFKLDDTEETDTSALIPEPIARALRNRKISIDLTRSTKKKEKKIIKKPENIVKIVEKVISSSEEDNNENELKIPKPPIRKKGKMKKGRNKNQGPQLETSKNDITSSSALNKSPPAKKKKRLLGLDIDPSAIIDVEVKADDNETPTRGSIRQSRRIAQLKIKEEAERRKLEELTLIELKEEQKKKKSKKDEDKDYKIDKKKKKYKESDDEDESEEEVEVITKIKHKKKRKHQDLKKLFNIAANPWQSSSGSSSSNEEEEEEEEVEEEPTDDEAVFKSDHEFSPESDLENNVEVQPLRRARTVKKESDTEEPTDEHACQKCGKADHPEWILLCDKCDCGWHCSCLRPALLVIPEGDWYCPPCQHISLVEALKAQLVEYDKRINRKEMEVRRKQRLAYVGISLANVLPSKDQEEKDEDEEEEEDENDNEQDHEVGSEEESSDSDSGSATETSSEDEDEPIYQLRERRQAHSYRFNDYDELINSAIQDELEAVKGAGNQGRGKDIATIVNAEKEEAKTQALLEQQQQQQQQEQQQQQQQQLENPQVENSQIENPPPIVPVSKEPKPEQEVEASEEYSDDEPRVVPKLIGRRKHRKLNSLDISSEDDPDDDEDFKGTSASEEEDFEDLGSEDSDDLELGRRSKGGRGPTRRSTRARTTRYDKDFINDDSEDEPRHSKKSRSIWDESESEESDKSWGKRKRRKRQRNSSTPRSGKKPRKKRRHEDSDPEVKRSIKKPKIKYGGLNESENEEFVTRRTRGKKINYIDALGSDSEEDKRKTKPLESEDEYVANEDDEEAMDVIDEKESDSDVGVGKVKLTGFVKGRGKAGIPRPQHLKPVSSSILTAPVPQSIQENFEDFDDDDPPVAADIPVIAANPDDLNEEEVGTMMMENEEYAKKQLELMAIQLAKEKKKKEREAKKLAEKTDQIVVVPPVEPKKRGRKKKSEIEAALANSQNLMPSKNIEQESNLDFSPVPTVISELATNLPKRRGRGKGKKTLAAEAAAAASLGPDSSSESISQPLETKPIAPAPNLIAPALQTDPNQAPNQNLLGGKLGIAAPPQPFSQNQPTPSVITRMLQSQPISAQTFTTGANSQKYFPCEQQPPRNSPSGQFSPVGGRGRIPSPYRQSPPGLNIYPGVRPVAPNSPHRLRSPGPSNMQIFHSTHHPMDPSPSGGGPINISTANRDRNSPNVPTKEAPPPPYSRATINRFSPNENSPGPSLQPQIRHIFPQTTIQQPSPPPRPPPGNFSPYHPPPPPNYHYGAYPPAPSLAAADDALPPTDYQNSPYPEHYTVDGTVHSSEGSNSKPFDEEGSGEFGGLVSYFSSQREDDLDT